VTQTDPERRFKPAGPMLVLAVAAVLIALAWLGIDHVFNLLLWMEQLIERYFWLSLLLFSLSFAGLVVVTLPVGSLFCVVGGYFFGVGLGAAAALIGASLGATLTFLMVRYGGGRKLRERVHEGRMQELLLMLERDATWYLILLRIIPVAPFFLVNATAGLTRIGYLQFSLATLAGLAPTTLIYASIGNGLGSILQARERAGPALLLAPEVAVPLAILVLIIILSYFARRRLIKSGS